MRPRVPRANACTHPPTHTHTMDGNTGQELWFIVSTLYLWDSSPNLPLQGLVDTEHMVHLRLGI